MRKKAIKWKYDADESTMNDEVFHRMYDDGMVGTVYVFAYSAACSWELEYDGEIVDSGQARSKKDAQDRCDSAHDRGVYGMRKKASIIDVVNEVADRIDAGEPVDIIDQVAVERFDDPDTQSRFIDQVHEELRLRREGGFKASRKRRASLGLSGDNLIERKLVGMRKKADWYYHDGDDDYSIGGDGWSANVWRGESGDSWEWYIYDYEQGERISYSYFDDPEDAKADCEREIAEMGLVEAGRKAVRKRKASLGTWVEEYDGSFFKVLDSVAFGKVQCHVFPWDDMWNWSIECVEISDVFDPSLYSGFVDTAEQGKAKCDALIDELEVEFADAGGFFAVAKHCRRKSSGIYGDDGWEEESPGYWVNYRLSDDIPSIFHDVELDGTGREYVVQVNGAETIDDDRLTESFGSLSEAVAYAEAVV